MLVALTLVATSGALAGCAEVGGGGAPTETEPPTYYTGGLGGGPGSTGQPNQNQYATPTSGGKVAPPTTGPAAPAPTGQAAPAPTTPGQPAGAFAAVDIEDLAYRPGTLNAQVGQKVVWSNQDSAPHTVTANNLTWGKNIAPGSTYVRVFDRPGTFPYHCAIHRDMRGILVVS